MDGNSWLARNTVSVRFVSVAVTCLSLGFTIGIWFGKSVGDTAAAKSNVIAKRAMETTEDCLGTLKRSLAHAPTRTAPDDATKHN